MKRILIIVFSDLKYDARVSRQIDFLRKDYEVSVIAYGKIPFPDVNFYKIGPTRLTFFKKLVLAILLLLRQFSRAYSLLYPYQKLGSQLADKKYDLIIANDIEPVPLAFEISDNKIPVWFDAHEYAPRHFEDQKWFKYFFQPFNNYLCKKYIPKVATMSTVSPGLINEYQKEFGIKPHLILNAPAYHELPVRPTGETIKIVHQGGATRSRHLEVMIEMMDYLNDNYHLYLMLLVPPRASASTVQYVSDLKAMAAGNSRIHFIDPVKHEEVVGTISQFDIGLFLLKPVNFNYTYTVPNKLLEFIQARLAVAIGPSPDMKTIVEEYKCGVVANSFEAQEMAEIVKKLRPADIDRLKENSGIAAKKINADQTRDKVLKIAAGILK